MASEKKRIDRMDDQGRPAEPDAVLSEGELRALALADPEARARADELVRQIRDGTVQGDGIPAGELAAFLRESYLASRSQIPG